MPTLFNTTFNSLNLCERHSGRTASLARHRLDRWARPV